MNKQILEKMNLYHKIDKILFDNELSSDKNHNKYSVKYDFSLILHSLILYSIF